MARCWLDGVLPALQAGRRRAAGAAARLLFGRQRSIYVRRASALPARGGLHARHRRPSTVLGSASTLCYHSWFHPQYSKKRMRRWLQPASKRPAPQAHSAAAPGTAACLHVCNGAAAVKLASWSLCAWAAMKCDGPVCHAHGCEVVHGVQTLQRSMNLRPYNNVMEAKLQRLTLGRKHRSMAEACAIPVQRSKREGILDMG